MRLCASSCIVRGIGVADASKKLIYKDGTVKVSYSFNNTSFLLAFGTFIKILNKKNPQSNVGIIALGLNA